MVCSFFRCAWSGVRLIGHAALGALTIATIGVLAQTAASAQAAAAAPTVNANPAFRFYDMSQTGVVPPTQEDGAQHYLVINLNPLYGQTIAVTIASNQTTQPPATQSVTGNAGSGNLDISVGSACLSPKDKTQQGQACLDLLQKQLHPELLRFVTSLQKYPTTDSMTSAVAADVELALSRFQDPANPAYVSFTNDTTLSQATRDYSAWVADNRSAHGLKFPEATADLAFYTTTTQDSIANDAALVTGVSAIYKSSQDPLAPQINAEITVLTGYLGTLQNATTTGLFQQAAKLQNQIVQITKQPNIAYYQVNAPCGKFGFSSSTYTVKFTEASTATGTAAPQAWNDAVTCYAELSVGAIYYYSGLNTDTYTLQMKSVNGTMQNVPVKQSAQKDEGSLAAVLNWCPDGGPSALCGAVAMSTGSSTNGLSGLVGIGYLFAHRVIGVYTGLRVGSVTALSSGYSANVTPVASGASYTHFETQASWFAGISLNIPSASTK